MMRGFVTVITAFLSIIFLGKKQYRHHWVALTLIVAALGEVGFIAIAYGEEDDGLVDSIALGIVLLLVAQVFAGGLFVVEEKLLSGYYLDPLKVVGTEGMFGTLYFLIALPIMQSVECSGPLCNFRYFENSSYAFA